MPATIVIICFVCDHDKYMRDCNYITRLPSENFTYHHNKFVCVLKLHIKQQFGIAHESNYDEL